jgi:hypothetical protein
VNETEIVNGVDKEAELHENSEVVVKEESEEDWGF